MTSPPISAPDTDGDLARLSRRLRAGTGTIAVVTLLFLGAAIAWVTVRGPVYEATAFAEVDAPADLVTIEQKLRFPSLYKKVAGSAEAARKLAERSRVKNLRNSRLIAVTVRDGDAAQAAGLADAIIEAYIDSDTDTETAAELRARIQVINELSDDGNQGSPAALLEALQVHKNGVEAAGREGDKAAAELAVKDRQLFESRVKDYLKMYRPQLGLAALDPQADFDPEATLKMTIAELGELYGQRGELDARARELEAGGGFSNRSTSLHLVEAATPPTQPAAPGALVICLSAIVLGGFCGALFVLLRSS